MNKGHNKSAAPLPKLIAPIVGLAHRFGDLNMDESPLRGAGIGASIGGPVGALYGALFPRSEYVQKKDKKGKPMYDKDGDPVYEMKDKSRLHEALSRGLTGAGIGGAVGVVPSLRKSLLSLGQARGGSTPQQPNRNPGETTYQPPSKDKRQVASTSLINELNRFKFPDETSAKASLREVVSPFYKDTEGGFDKAVENAEKYRDDAKKLGLVTFNQKDLDAPINISSKGKDIDKMIDMLNTRKGIGSYSGRVSRQNLGGTTARGPYSTYGDVVINPDSKDRYSVLGHEMTHAAFGPANPKNELISPSQIEAMKKLLKGRISVSPSEFDNFAKYVGNPSEWGAHLSEAKRFYSKDLGKQIATPADAQKVLDYYMSDRYPRKTDALRRIMPMLLNSDDLKKKAIMQILSIVKGNPAAPGTGMA